MIQCDLCKKEVNNGTERMNTFTTIHSCNIEGVFEALKKRGVKDACIRCIEELTKVIPQVVNLKSEEIADNIIEKMKLNRLKN